MWRQFFLQRSSVALLLKTLIKLLLKGLNCATLKLLTCFFFKDLEGLAILYKKQEKWVALLSNMLLSSWWRFHLQKCCWNPVQCSLWQHLCSLLLFKSNVTALSLNDMYMYIPMFLPHATFEMKAHSFEIAVNQTTVKWLHIHGVNAVDDEF